MNRQHRQFGFTIVELLVTLVIVSILATVMLPMAELTVRRNREHELRQSLRQIREALDAYKQAIDDGRIAGHPGASGYPPSLNALVDGVTDRRSSTGAKMVFLRRVPRDPLHQGTDVPAANTWGLRSYVSSAEDPKEGEDVYDVYSTSPGNGLNGVPYRDW